MEITGNYDTFKNSHKEKKRNLQTQIRAAAVPRASHRSESIKGLTAGWEGAGFGTTNCLDFWTTSSTLWAPIEVFETLTVPENCSIRAVHLESKCQNDLFICLCMHC